MFIRVSTILLAIAALSAADTLTLRNGEVVRGEYLGGDARHVKMAIGDRVETYSIEDVSDLHFGGGGGGGLRQSSDNDRRDNGIREAPPANAQQAPPVGGSLVPAGTTITVRMIDAVNSDQTRVGQTFRASVDEAVLVDGQAVIPRGSDAVVKLVEDKESGKIEGRTVLTLVLQQVMTNGRTIDLTTGDVSQSSGSRGARSGKVIGGLAALGAIVGGIAGGGKGAAIGAGSGAAVGTGVQVMTKGQTVKIPSETRLTFTLQQPAQL
jgi:hypothetical protein